MHVSSSEIQVFIIFYILIVNDILINIYLEEKYDLPQLDYNLQ